MYMYSLIFRGLKVVLPYGRSLSLCPRKWISADDAPPCISAGMMKSQGKMKAWKNVQVSIGWTMKKKREGEKVQPPSSGEENSSGEDDIGSLPNSRVEFMAKWYLKKGGGEGGGRGSERGGGKVTGRGKDKMLDVQ